VTVYDVISDGGTTYIVMELIEAPTLAELVRAHGPLPPARVAAIGEQVLTALQAAHHAGIVHRDVKPGNIMVAPDGRVKLTDFGIAQAADDPRLTTSGMLVGSPAFMAPERVAGHDAVPASDLWSLGASLFFAAEGVMPFERSSTAATLHAIMNEVPYLARTQGALASTIMGLLVSVPEARISTEQARGLLAAVARQQTVSYPMPGAGPTMVQSGGLAVTPAARSARRRGALVTGAVLAAVALLAGGIFLGKPVWSPPVDEAMQPTLTYGPGGDLGELNIDSIDTCVDTPIARGRSLAPSNWVDCEEPHDAEQHATAAPLPVSHDSDAAVAVYPGLERVRAYGETFCAATFHSNAVPAQRRANLNYRVLVPTKTAWDRRPDPDSVDDPVRDVRCFLVARDGGRLTGSVVREVA
jgi:hypothetical protein